MKFSDALEMWNEVEGAPPPGHEEEAKTCAVNNVHLHAMNFFAYGDIPKELEELDRTAKEAGVRFSTACGDALLPTDKEEEHCYICKALIALTLKGAKVVGMGDHGCAYVPCCQPIHRSRHDLRARCDAGHWSIFPEQRRAGWLALAQLASEMDVEE